MRKMFFSTAVGALTGVALSAAFAIFSDTMMGVIQPLALWALVGMSAFANVGAIFGAVSVIQDEAREIRREIKRGQLLDPAGKADDRPVTQIKPSNRGEN
jgi:hypothetical protein